MVELEKQNFEYNKKLYKKIENELRKKLDKSIPIEQVGSTAIPNMYGKNIIDILIGAIDDIQFEQIANKLVELGFFPSKKKSEIYQFFASTENETSSGDIHIHLVIMNTERYEEFIILKKYLLNNPEETGKYSEFKQEMLKTGIKDRNEYKKVKSEYVTSLIERAKK